MSSSSILPDKGATHSFRRDPWVWLLVLLVVVPMVWAIALGTPPGPRPAPAIQSLLQGVSLLSAGTAFMWSFLSQSNCVVLQFVRYVAANYLYPSGRFTAFVAGICLLAAGMLWFSGGFFR